MPTLHPAPMPEAELEDLLQTYREAAAVAPSDRTIKLLNHILWQAERLAAYEAAFDKETSNLAARCGV